MTRTIENANRVVKITLALCAIVFYALGLIRGPFALTLFILACLTIIAFLVKIAYKWLTMD
jgi:hypothetical protein